MEYNKLQTMRDFFAWVYLKNDEVNAVLRDSEKAEYEKAIDMLKHVHNKLLSKSAIR